MPIICRSMHALQALHVHPSSVDPREVRALHPRPGHPRGGRGGRAPWHWRQAPGEGAGLKRCVAAGSDAPLRLRLPPAAAREPPTWHR